MAVLYVEPINDLIAHEDSDECPCGPTTEFVDGGSLVIHHSLDGREKDEED